MKRIITNMQRLKHDKEIIACVINIDIETLNNYLKEIEADKNEKTED